MAQGRTNTIDDVLLKIEVTPSCWLWKGYSHGYGYISMNGVGRLAHRVVYEFFRGAIPQDMTLDHLCRNKLCVNPAHLEVVTRGENTLRGDTITGNNLRKTHCKRGHSLEDAFPVKCPSGKFGRACRHCLNIHKKHYRLVAKLSEGGKKK